MCAKACKKVAKDETKLQALLEDTKSCNVTMNYQKFPNVGKNKQKLVKGAKSAQTKVANVGQKFPKM